MNRLLINSVISLIYGIFIGVFSYRRGGAVRGRDSYIASLKCYLMN